MHALRAATRDATRFLGRADLGVIAQGARADLVVLRGDPVRRLPDTPEILTIIHRGREIAPADLIDEAKPLLTTLPDDPWSK